MIYVGLGVGDARMFWTQKRNSTLAPTPFTKSVVQVGRVAKPSNEYNCLASQDGVSPLNQ